MCISFRLSSLALVLLFTLLGCVPSRPDALPSAVATPTPSHLATDSPSPASPSPPSTTPSPVVPQVRAATGTPTLTEAEAITAELKRKVCDNPWDWDRSPNNDWISVRCSNEGLPDALVIFNQATHVKWTLLFHEVYQEGGSKDSLGSLDPVHWSIDGRYLFLSASVAVDPGFLLSDGQALYRLDLTDGKTSTIIRPESRRPFAFTFSSDDRFLAYAPHYWEPLAIRVAGLSSGSEKFLPIGDPYDMVGYISWSPSDEWITALIAYGDFRDPTVQLAIFNVPSGTHYFLPDPLPLGFRPLKWTSETTLEFRATSANAQEASSVWTLDVETRQLTKPDKAGP